MKTFALFLASLLVHPVLAGFGGTPDAALKPSTGKHRRWSSTGMEGHDHRDTSTVSDVSESKTPPESTKEDEHPHHEHPLEHHPYASGVFTIDPHDV